MHIFVLKGGVIDKIHWHSSGGAECDVQRLQSWLDGRVDGYF